LFVDGLAVANVKHCGFLAFAVALCAVDRRSSARTWPVSLGL